MSETAGLVTVILSVIMAIVIVTLVGCHEVEQTKREGFKAGYVQKPSQTTYEHWEKP